METRVDNTDWLSAHLHFDASNNVAEYDQVLKQYVEPFVRLGEARGWIDRYFFIRYSVGGHHVRLRLHGLVEVLEKEVKPALMALGQDQSPYDDAWFQHNFSQQQIRLTKILWIPYEPEWDRYGGHDGIAVAERFFHLSSDVALALLQDVSPNAQATRLGKALLSMVVLIHAFCEHRPTAAAFCERYYNYYRLTPVDRGKDQGSLLGAFENGYERQADSLALYVEDAWNRLEGTESLSSKLDEYSAGLRQVKEELDLLRTAGRLTVGSAVLTDWRQVEGAIVPSYMHMMNNRLGVPIPSESYLGYMIARTLNSTTDASSDRTRADQNEQR